MIEAVALEPVDAVTVTTLVDNVTDSLLADQGPATRPSMTAAPRMPARLLRGGETDDALRAEHGFSALVTIAKGERERGFPGHQAHRHGGWEPDPLILDDQALVARVRGQGLVVLTGCGHSGIVNILRYVRTLTGEDRVHAVVGGFHLSGRAFEPIIGPTCDALEELAADYLVPTHCTGWRATHALAARFPDAFIPNCVGTRFEFAATASG